MLPFTNAKCKASALEEKMKVLVAYDGSKCADAAIDDLQRAGLPREGEALVVCVADESWPMSKEISTEMETFANIIKSGLQEAEKLAQSGRDRFQRLYPGWNISAQAVWGTPAKSILKTVATFLPDLLLIGSHGRTAVGRVVFGSVSLSLIHHASCTIRIVRDKPASTGPIRILVATDGSLSGQEAVRIASTRSWPSGTQARLVAVVNSLVPELTGVPALEASTFTTEPAFQVILEADKRERERLTRIVDESAKALEAGGLHVDPVVLEGSPRTEILTDAKAWRAETIFIGARGLGALDRLVLGSVSTAVVTHAECTVEVVRH
jgi:nucleotide-binding universal stress UspA family protein